MAAVLTARDLAQLIARNPDDPDRLREALHRVQHFDRSGLYDMSRTRIGEQRVGRGRSRTYNSDAATWTRLFSTMLNNGLGILEMVLTIQAVKDERRQAKLAGREDLWSCALRGGQPDVILMVPSESEHRISEGLDHSERQGVITHGHHRIVEGADPKLMTSDDRVPGWTAGKFINLTRALA